MGAQEETPMNENYDPTLRSITKQDWAVKKRFFRGKQGPAANDASSRILGHILLSEYGNSHLWWYMC